MQLRELAGGAITTSALGLGSAELFSLPRARDRRSLLETAYDLGVRHFDVAPMYGLGAAEPELGSFVRGRRDDLTIATKFGIDPGSAGRLLRTVQPPLRAALRRAPGLKAGLKEAGRGPGAGGVGRVLYRRTGYTRAAARASLERSLRTMRIDHVDLFLLHEPPGRLDDLPDLADHLEHERTAGRIRAWGLAGDLGAVEAADAVRLGSRVVQRRDDLRVAPEPDAAGSSLSVVTFGVLSGMLPAIRRLATQAPDAAEQLRAEWGLELGNTADVVGLLLREALRRNPHGVVLYSTTSADHLRDAVTGAAAAPLRDEAGLLVAVRAALSASASDRTERT